MKWEYQKERDRRNIWNNNDWELPQINTRHQITNPWSLENKKQDKCQKNDTQAYHFQTTENQDKYWERSKINDRHEPQIQEA